MFLSLLCPLFMIFIGLFSFSSSRKHLLLMLMSLEFVVLSIYFLLFHVVSFINFYYFFMMFFLIFSVCESVLGLSVLVSLIRSHGNDYFNVMNLFMWQ